MSVTVETKVLPSGALATRVIGGPSVITRLLDLHGEAHKHGWDVRRVEMPRADVEQLAVELNFRPGSFLVEPGQCVAEVDGSQIFVSAP